MNSWKFFSGISHLPTVIAFFHVALGRQEREDVTPGGQVDRLAHGGILLDKGNLGAVGRVGIDIGVSSDEPALPSPATPAVPVNAQGSDEVVVNGVY